MKRYILLLFITITITANMCNGLEISSKLDFGSSKLISTTSHHDTPLRSHNTKREEIKNDFDNIGVVCVSGGCNKTKSNESPDESFKTDVVVHVETIVDVKKNKTNFVDDTPDVPVVLGLAGTNLESENHRDFKGAIYEHPEIPSTNLYSQPIVTDTIYIKNTNQGVNVKTLPPVMLGNGYDQNRPNGIVYNTNGLKLNLPHFEPSYNMHYFGENSPPQLLWYPRRPGTFNPVEFKNIPKPTWDFSSWNRRVSPTYSPKFTGQGQRTNDCECKNHQGTGLQWQPNGRSFPINNQDPGRQINDKLAPLN